VFCRFGELLLIHSHGTILRLTTGGISSGALPGSDGSVATVVLLMRKIVRSASWFSGPTRPTQKNHTESQHATRNPYLTQDKTASTTRMCNTHQHQGRPLRPRFKRSRFSESTSPGVDVAQLPPIHSKRLTDWSKVRPVSGGKSPRSCQHPVAAGEVALSRCAAANGKLAILHFSVSCAFSVGNLGFFRVCFCCYAFICTLVVRIT